MIKYFYSVPALAVCIGLAVIACNVPSGHGGEALRRSGDDQTQKIFGVWAFAGDRNATFVIDKDSIFYPDHNGTYKYIFKNDSLHINFDDHIGHYLVRMRGTDTLVLEGDEQSIFYRFNTGVVQDEVHVSEPMDELTTGVVGLNDDAKEALKIYNHDGTVWRSIDLTKDDSYDSLVKPFSIKLDYKNLVFRCAGMDGKYYEVIADERSGLLKYIRRDDPDFYFQTWEQHVLHIFSVGFDVSKNPLKVMPDSAAQNITFDKEGYYHPVEVKGDWMKVEYGDADRRQAAWIRWKNKNTLLIEIFYTS